jgi:hypothetical protein
VINWLDAKGARIFKPLVIFICQRTGLTQYALYRYLWMTVAVLAVYGALVDKDGWVWLTIVGLWAVITTVVAATIPNHPVNLHPVISQAFRVLFIVLSIVHALGHVASLATTGTFGWHVGCPTDLLVLLAEYAATITTIPPREIKEKKRQAKLAEATL